MRLCEIVAGNIRARMAMLRLSGNDVYTFNAISCEGILASTVKVKNEFTSEYKRLRHQEIYCFGFNYGRCPIAEALQKKYSTGGEKKDEL